MLGIMRKFFQHALRVLVVLYKALSRSVKKNLKDNSRSISVIEVEAKVVLKMSKHSQTDFIGNYR